MSGLTRRALLTFAASAALLSPLAGEAGAQWRRGRVQPRGRVVTADPRAAQRMSSVDPRLLAAAQHYSGDNFTIETTTPRGVRVYAVNGPNAQTLNAIDAGLA